MSGIVTTELESTDSNEYVLLQRGHYPARTGKYYGRICEHTDVPHVLPHISRSRIVALDWETVGLDYSDVEQRQIVGLGLAWDTGSCYFHYEDLIQDPDRANELLDVLLNHTGLIAHNVYFDGGIIYSNFGVHARWHACTSALYKQLANEGWVGQVHGLKHAQTDLLGWESSNETELDEWLVASGHYIGNRRLETDPAKLVEMYHSRTETGKRRLSPDKSKMYLAPREILGKYCVLDAEACYLLYVHVLEPVLQQFPDLEYYHHVEFMHLIYLHIEQKMGGILMDREGLLSRQQILTTQISELEHKFLTHPQTAEHIRAIESDLRRDLYEKEPPRYKKRKERTEPDKYKKNGEISKNWIRWKELSELPPEQSRSWENWAERVRVAEAGENPDYNYNLNSGPQLRELFYNRLKYTPREETESGDDAIGVSSLKHVGEEGQLLVERAHLVKELSYINDYLERTVSRPSLHPDFRLPGPCTGRLSSANPNMQQISKTWDVMSLFLADAGEEWVDIDFKALESVVAAELSGCPNLLELYGDGKPENDIHLFVCAHVPAWRSEVEATGYTPYNPPPGSVSRAKKECKSKRNIMKNIVYAKQYGAGNQKIFAMMQAAGVPISYEEVEEISSTYDRLFERVDEYKKELEWEWQQNGGYVMNALGRPMCVTEDYKKDLFNRVIQSTGHDILVKYAYILTYKLDEEGISWRPVIIDFHDATTVGTPVGNGQRVAELMQWSMGELNRKLQGTITLGGVPVIGRNLAQVKEPEQ
jgi:DNA polymerase I-like protein with 3'-5' exonuclease and polymerase domains